MRLIAILNDREKELCSMAGIKIKDEDYKRKELSKVEKKLLNYLNENCVDENDNDTPLGTEYEDLIEKLIDYDEEMNDEENIMRLFVGEGSKVKLKDGRIGTVVDVTENMYTIEIDDSFKKGDAKDDIQIVDLNKIDSLMQDDDEDDDIYDLDDGLNDDSDNDDYDYNDDDFNDEFDDKF